MSLSINIKEKKYPSYDQLILKLVDFGFNRVRFVLEPGEFAVRGHIVDVFDCHHVWPFRFDFDDTHLDRLTEFDPHSQQSKKNKIDIVIKPVTDKPLAYPLRSERIAENKAIVSNLFEGNYVVHERYGIGIYKGLVSLVKEGVDTEYIYIQYKGRDKLYVPLDQLHFIHKYSETEVNPKVNALYDGSWNRTTRRVNEQTAQLASSIYHLYQKRLQQKGFAFSEDSEKQLDFEQLFEHPLTDDQEKAVKDIKKDMESHRPMDRLLCGDVGFGKTEVMLRAAFKALENNKQVMILVPTTVLAQQHYKTFKARLEPFFYSVEVLSRFSSKSNQQRIIKALKKQTSDIVIGTHRLLQGTVTFNSLGLLVIDEEQRFGVTHKEAIKKIKTHVDVLSVSATPIPRTMYMSLTGAKDITVIESPPQKRKPVQTFVLPYKRSIIQEAIDREMATKGQVFYLFNKVETIVSKQAELERQFPHLKIDVAHGQLSEARLQRVMIDFIENRLDILVCSTIIENGMDILNVNTIIIEHAERLGLSQIHQLRGRVGRTPKQAYAYILYDPIKQISEKATKRLQAIKEYVALGSGYELAMKDLEIRGAGNLFGRQQHGHVASVGFTLYCKLLEQSVKKAKGDPIEEDFILALSPEKIRIPDTYIDNPRERLSLYQRFIKLDSHLALRDLENSLQDRYGRFDEKMREILDYLSEELYKRKASI